jgi:DNA-binding CsgD family transcriptional regulator
MLRSMTAAGSDPLLEREGEIAALHELLADARGGRGRLLLLEAPAGLGKSTLAEHAVAAAEGFRVLRASGHELERGLGWGVARSLFERWLLALPAADRDELLAGPAAPARVLFEPADAADERGAQDVSFGILHGLHWLAVRIAELGPLLLVVDDAHWVDEPSLRFLLYMLGRVHDHPMALLVAARTGERGEGGLLAQLSTHPALQVRDLAPLGAAAVGDLVRRRVATADERFCRRCFELTRGNPLQVRELISALVHTTPAGADLNASAERAARSLSRSVLRRLSALSPAAQSLARALAVLDGDAPLHQAAALAELDPPASLAAADVLARADIAGPGDPVGFVHPLLRAAVYGALSLPERARLHRRAARVLAEHDAPREQVGAHLLEAPPAGDDAVVDGLRAAARDALAHGVPAAAVRYLERALREPPSRDARADVLAALGRAELGAGRSEAAAHLEAATALMDDPRRRAALRLELGRTLHDFGRPGEACDVFERGTAELGERSGDDLARELEAWFLTSAMLVPERASDARRRVEAILARPGRPATAAERVLVSKAMIMRVYAGGTREELVPLGLRLFGAGRLLEQDGIESQAVAHVAGTLSYCDEYGHAGEVLGLMLARSRQRGLVTFVGVSHQLRARQRLWTGPLPDAIEDARMAYEIFSAGLQMYLPATAYCLARGLVEADEREQAEAILAALERAPAPRGPFAAWHHETAGRLAAHRGAFERALEAFLAAGTALQEVGMTNPAMFHWRSEAGLAAVRLGRRDLALELISDEQRLAEAFGAPRAIGVAQRAAGMLERGERAVELLRGAAELLERCAARVEHALALVELGAAVRRAGRATEARAILRQGMALADTMGARAVARRAREELVLAGGRAPASRDVAGELTPSERRVAELAAAGRTNREIANELFVTVKAVEWHLRNVYRKLDVRGRRELAQALASTSR